MVALPRRQHLDVEDVEDVTVVYLSKPVLRDPDVRLLGEALYRLVDQRGRRKLLLDFRGIECLDSRELSGLVALNEKLKGLGGWLSLSNAGPQVLEALRLANLTKFFDVRQP